MSRAIAAVAMAVCCLVTSVRAQDYSLQPIRITSNVPVKVSIGGDPTVSSPIYQAVDGAWKPLTVEEAGGSVAFTQPADAMATTLVLLDKPAWLQLPDDEPPSIEAVRVDDAAVEPGEEIKLGNLSHAPQAIVLAISDAKNPLALSRALVSLDGRELSSSGGAVAMSQSQGGRHAEVTITLGDLPQAAHSILVTVPDASPGLNTVRTVVSFSTAPMLANAGFEEADSAGKPLHWACSTWSADAETKAEFKVVDGGRTGKALLIEGIAGSLNMVCGQGADLVPGRTYVLSGYYKSTVAAGYASVIGQAGGKQDQYANMPRLAQADDWTPFSWEVTAKEDNTGFNLYLRSGGQGKIWFDDVSLELKR